MAAHCAGEQDKFWEMSGKIFEHFREFEPADLPAYAAELGLDAAEFEECFASDRHDETVNRHKSAGSRASVRGTPTFLLGYTGEGGTEFKPVELIRGAYPYATFQQKIDALLEKAEDEE